MVLLVLVKRYPVGTCPGIKLNAVALKLKLIKIMQFYYNANIIAFTFIIVYFAHASRENDPSFISFRGKKITREIQKKKKNSKKCVWIKLTI